MSIVSCNSEVSYSDISIANQGGKKIKNCYRSGAGHQAHNHAKMGLAKLLKNHSGLVMVVVWAGFT